MRCFSLPNPIQLANWRSGPGCDMGLTLARVAGKSMTPTQARPAAPPLRLEEEIGRVEAGTRAAWRSWASIRWEISPTYDTGSQDCKEGERVR